MNNTQQALSNDDPEAIRRLQREWRIAKRKELEDKKRKKKYRTLETSVIQDVAHNNHQYITMQSSSVSLPQSSAATAHFQLQPHMVQGQTTASNPLFANPMQVGSAPSHSQPHTQVDYVDGKHHQATHHHSAANISRDVQSRSQENVQYPSHHGVHSNRDPGQCSPSSLPHGIVQDNPGSINTSVGMSQHLGGHYLSPVREGSTFTTFGEHKVSHVQGTNEDERPMADVNRAENSVALSHAMTEEARQKMEVEEAQRRWRENKRKELAMKRARAASSKRGRKRTKFLHHHQIIGHPVQVVSANTPLHPTVPFTTSSGVTSGLPLSSSLHNPTTVDQLQVSSSEVPSAVVRSMGASSSEPISTSIAMSSPAQVSVSFPLSSVPIPSSVAVPVVPALTIQHVQTPSFGTAHDPETGFSSLPLHSAHQFSGIVTTERVPQNGTDGSALNSIPAEDSAMVYEPLSHNARDQRQTSGSPTSIPVAPVVCATDMMESRALQNEVSNNENGRGDSKLHSTTPAVCTPSHVKVNNENGVDHGIGDDEGHGSRAGKDDADYTVQTPIREQDKDTHANERATELEVRGTISTIDSEVHNTKPSPASERTVKQFEEQGKRSEENVTGKEFEVPQETFQDAGDELMNSVTWQSLGSIENP